MGLFNTETIKDAARNTNTVSVTYNRDAVSEAMEYKVLKDVAQKITNKVTEDIYSEVLAKIDKDTIVREVSLKVSENVLSKLFRSEK